MKGTAEINAMMSHHGMPGKYKEKCWWETKSEVSVVPSIEGSRVLSFCVLLFTKNHQRQKKEGDTKP